MCQTIHIEDCPQCGSKNTFVLTEDGKMKCEDCGHKYRVGSDAIGYNEKRD